MTDTLKAWNARAFARADVHRLALAEFDALLARRLEAGWRLVSLLGVPGAGAGTGARRGAGTEAGREPGRGAGTGAGTGAGRGAGREGALPLPLLGILSDPAGGSLAVLATELAEAYPALTLGSPQAARFERELWEQYGVRPVGHPWLKPVRSQAGHGPGRYSPKPSGGEVGISNPSPDENSGDVGVAYSSPHENTEEVGVAYPSPHESSEEIGVAYPFFRMEGSAVHEVAVGPVHAGIIEPGHFRFQCHGEVVHHLEIVLGYQHRGLERSLVGGPHPISRWQIEELAGDSTVAHALAYAQAGEALAGCAVPPRAQALRAIALELERVAAHTGDLGALAGDIAFLPTAAWCGRLRGAFLNITAELCGNRFGRSFIRPGGVSADISPARAERLAGLLEQSQAELSEAVELFFGSGSVLARLEGVGVLTREQAIALGVVGVAARASGLAIDARHDHATGLYRMAHIPVATAADGDVHARAVVRWLELQRSLEFLRTALRELAAGEVLVPCGRAEPDAVVVSLVEGWRGEVVHVAVTDDDGRFGRYQVVDPSFRNWPALELVMRGQQISDFPLCNKSFNLSYSGHDL